LHFLTRVKRGQLSRLHSSGGKVLHFLTKSAEPQQIWQLLTCLPTSY